MGKKKNRARKKRGRPLIAPSNHEQKKKEEVFKERVRSAEREVAHEILTSGPPQRTLLEVIDNARGFAEYGSIKSRHPDTPPVACKLGCSWCCFQSVAITPPEVFRIVNYMNNEINTDKRITLVQKLKELDKKTKGLKPIDRSKKKLACAFLENNMCSIYDVRPLACAEFTSFDVEDCKKGYEQGFKPNSIIHEKARMHTHHAVQEGLQQALITSFTKADHVPLELTSAVIAALETSSAIEDWIDGGKVFHTAHFVSDNN